MFIFILGVLLAAGAVICWVLQKAYQHVPVKEIKRLARGGDEVAKLIYRAASYEVSLEVLLAGLAILFGALSLACMVYVVGIWFAIVLLLVVLAVGGFVFVPGDELTRSSLWLAKKAAPVVSWVLERTLPVIDFLARFVQKHRPVRLHTGLYDKEDLAELLERQKGQPDSRISASEIALLQHALSFGDKLVADALIPKRVIKTVAANEAIGPVLMDELSKSGHSRFPVFDGKHDNIVGILYLHDLVSARHVGTVSDLMSTKLTYVHEDFSLYQTLQAFLKTKHHLFLTVNSFEEFVGIITIEDVIEQMIGKPIVDEFDKYNDLRAVAAAAAKKDHASHPEPKLEVLPNATTEPSEVIE